MIDGNFEWITVWVDDTMDKNNWYRGSKNSKIIDGILVDKQTSYNMLRTLNQQTVTPEEYIQEARKDLNEIVAYANQFISKYREYANGIFSESELVNEVKYYLQHLYQSSERCMQLSKYNWGLTHLLRNSHGILNIGKKQKKSCHNTGSQ